MKRYLVPGLFMVILFSLASCSGKYMLSSNPNSPHYVRPAAPGADHVWVEGDWRQRNGKLVWFEGRWVKNKPNKEWQQGYWTSRNDNWYWKRGHWAVR